MTRRIKWDRKVVDRARELHRAGNGAAEVRDELKRERGIEIPYYTVVDWLNQATRTRHPRAERGNLATGPNTARIRRTLREQSEKRA